jgi:hypothetical protein
VNKTGNLRVAHAIHVSHPHGYTGNVGEQKIESSSSLLRQGLTHRTGATRQAISPMPDCRYTGRFANLLLTASKGMRAYSLSLARDACIHSCDRERERGRGRGRGREEGKGRGGGGGRRNLLLAVSKGLG